MSFVDFMIIGAMKSGTTTLANTLAEHPDICFCQKKEPHFFSKIENWQQHLDSYRSLYAPTGNQICGEASTTYTCYPEFNQTTWKALYEFNPKLKLIYIMRHPIDRMVSHYMHTYLRRYTDGSFEDEILNNPSYLNRTRYFVQIKPYLERFGEEQVLLLTFEEFLSDKRTSLHRIAEFLNIDFAKFRDFETVHKNKSVGAATKNIKIERLKENALIKTVKPLIPSHLRTSASSSLRHLTARRLDSKPSISTDLKDVLWNLVMLDVLEIEKLMKRELVEWNIPKSPLANLEAMELKV